MATTGFFQIATETKTEAKIEAELSYHPVVGLPGKIIPALLKTTDVLVTLQSLASNSTDYSQESKTHFANKIADDYGHRKEIAKIFVDSWQLRNLLSIGKVQELRETCGIRGSKVFGSSDYDHHLSRPR